MLFWQLCWEYVNKIAEALQCFWRIFHHYNWISNGFLWEMAWDAERANRSATNSSLSWDLLYFLKRKECLVNWCGFKVHNPLSICKRKILMQYSLSNNTQRHIDAHFVTICICSDLIRFLMDPLARKWLSLKTFCLICWGRKALDCHVHSFEGLFFSNFTY